jgi:pyridoxal phosphate phosphatase PHOSPHO2
VRRSTAATAPHRRHAAAAAMAPPRTLLALDFDWSLIEENSDTFVIRELGADAIYQAGRERKLPWTQLMDHVLAEAAAQLGRTPADVSAALHRTPLHPALADVLRRAAAAGDSGSSSGAVDTVIVSDANTVGLVRKVGVSLGCSCIDALTSTGLLPPCIWSTVGTKELRCPF